MTQTRTFKMHPKLLFDVILRQAGTLSKAILEGIMNSADAKATKVEISITNDTVTIKDDGFGITNIDDIETFFETFGQPHAENEGKIYAQFRMGRGQMFAFGVNKWKTGPFSMDIDIKNKGLDYALKQGRTVKGCQIEIKLYDKLLPSDLEATIRDLETWVKYAPLQVIVNTRTLSIDPETEDWDHVTPDAFIRLKEHGGLHIYNLGVHTMTFGAYQLGTSGTVVSRKQLKVNFARNDIQSDCPVWKRIKPLVNRYAAEKIDKKKALNDDERQRIVDRFLAKEITLRQLQTYKVVTAVTGRQYELTAINNKWKWKQVTVAPKGNRIGDKLMKTGTAFVVATETLDRFHVKSLDELRFVICKHGGHPNSWDFKVTDFNKISKGLSDKYEILESAEWTANEKLWIQLLSKAYRWCNTPEGHGWDRRQLVIGISDVANAWTDGQSYIAFNRTFLRKMKFTIPYLGQVARVLVHECCHTTPDLEDHDHDQAFYETFHDAADNIGHLIDSMLGHTEVVCKVLKRRMTKEQLKTADRVARSNQSIESVAAHIG